MRAVEVARYGGPEVLRIVDRPEPVAGGGRVRVRMHATAVNPVDLAIRSGGLAAMTPGLAVPFVLGYDIAGTLLDDAGPGLPAGQRVVGVHPWLQEGTGQGTYAEVVLADPAWLAPLADGVDWAAAGTLPLNALTARQSLDLLEVHPGDTLLVTGASGAVGSFAVQLAAAAGVEVLAVSSTGDEAHVASLGAKDVLSRAEPGALADQVRERVPGGVDRVLDAALLGGPLLAAVRDGGGFLSVVGTSVPPAERDIRVTSVLAEPDSDALGELAAALAHGDLRTRVAATLPLAEAAEAHRRAAAGGQRGKLVLTL